MDTYEVYEGHMDDLRKKVARIQNKCKKFGCDFHYAEIGEVIKEVEDPNTCHPITGKHYTVKCKYIVVEVEGTAVVNGWEFVASVEHTEEGNIFSKALVDVEIPERYRTTDPICEHCHSNRMRKDTFIIRNTESGEFKQVGKSCLKDFTGGMDASAAAWFASLKGVFEEAQQESVGGFGWSARYFDTDEVLRFTAETIRHFGFVKSENDDGFRNPNSTRNRMEEFLLVSHGQVRCFPEDVVNEIKNRMQTVKFNPNSHEAVSMADAAKAWITGLDRTNDYLHNLKVACSLKECHMGRFGLLVSLFPTYDRELAYLAEKAEREAKAAYERASEAHSEHVGDLKQRITVQIHHWKVLSSWESCFDGYHEQTTYLYKFVDVDGNVFTWKTSKTFDGDDELKTITGTVKNHSEFRGTKQTELTRCKVA